jgi:23S rRNA (pseudouridine1915-N3)-methyltransferase
MIVLSLLLLFQSLFLSILAFNTSSSTNGSSFTQSPNQRIQQRQQLQRHHYVQRHPSSSSSSSAMTLKMGLEINIRIVGRKNSIESTSFLQEGYETYTKRLSSSTGIKLSTTFHKSNADLLQKITLDSKKGHGIICLDEKGTMDTSIDFSTKLYNWFEEYGSRLVFVIGGADGLPKELKEYQYSNMYGGKNNNGGILNRSPIFMSLSKMTFTHPWARTILVEQIYRASEIHKGSGYHKE